MAERGQNNVRLRAVAHDAGDRNEQSGTMLSPNNGEITPTGN